MNNLPPRAKRGCWHQSTSARTLFCSDKMLSTISQHPLAEPSHGTSLKLKPITQFRSQLGHETSCVSLRVCTRWPESWCVCLCELVFTIMSLCSCWAQHNAGADQYKHCYMAHRHWEGPVRVITLSSGGVCIISQPNSLDLNVGQYTHTHTQMSVQLFQMQSSGSKSRSDRKWRRP